MCIRDRSNTQPFYLCKGHSPISDILHHILIHSWVRSNPWWVWYAHTILIHSWVRSNPYDGCGMLVVPNHALHDTSYIAHMIPFPIPVQTHTHTHIHTSLCHMSHICWRKWLRASQKSPLQQWNCSCSQLSQRCSSRGHLSAKWCWVLCWNTPLVSLQHPSRIILVLPPK